MPNISNVFYWDIQTNNKVAFKDIDSIKTKYLIKCKEKNDKLIVEPFDETESVFKETKAWLFIAEIKKYYTNINEFKIKFKKDKEWDWHTFVKKENEDIELVGEDEEINDEEIIKPKNDKKTFMDKLKGLVGLSGTEKTVGTDGLSNINEIPNSVETSDTKQKNDLSSEQKIPLMKIYDYNKDNVNTFLSNGNEYSKYGKKSFDEYASITEMSDEEIDMLEDEDAYNQKYDEENIGTIRRKGMGELYAIQNLIPNGKRKEHEEMYNTIMEKLKIIYNTGKKINDKKVFNNLIMETVKSNESLAELALIYGRFLYKWNKNEGDKDIKGSKRFHEAMTSYFPEILSPFVILYNDKLNNKEPIIELKKKLNKNINDSLLSDAYIGYPISKSQTLFDSVIYFKSNNTYKCIRISTKGGKNGLGAEASIVGLKSYFYKKSLIEPEFFYSYRKNFDAYEYRDCYTDIMKWFASQSENNAIALKIISLLMLSTKTKYNDIIDAIYNKIAPKNKKNNISISNKASYIQEYMNSHEEFQDCVLLALKYASYDFAQLNFVESNLNPEQDFHYDIYIQYPAIFKGKIAFKLINGTNIHKLKFHIVGDNMK